MAPRREQRGCGRQRDGGRSFRIRHTPSSSHPCSPRMSIPFSDTTPYNKPTQHPSSKSPEQSLDPASQQDLWAPSDVTPPQLWEGHSGLRVIQSPCHVLVQKCQVIQPGPMRQERSAASFWECCSWLIRNSKEPSPNLAGTLCCGKPQGKMPED